MPSVRRLLYASFGVTTHDVRFLKVAATIFDRILYLRFDGQDSSPLATQLPENVTLVDWFGTRQSISSAEPLDFVEPFTAIIDDFKPHLTHAGPLSSVAWVASYRPTAPVLGMSWATDVLVDAQTPSGADRVSTTCQKLSGLITDSQTTAALARNFGFGGDRLAVFPWGVDLDVFPFSPLPPMSPIRLASVRSHEPIYDIPTIVEGFSDAVATSGSDNLSLTVLGKGSTTAECVQLANQRGVGSTINWQAPCAESALPVLFAEVHGTISAARSDGSSISMLQTMACGRIPIVTDIPSNVEWIQDGINGFIFEVGSSVSLADTLTRISLLGPNLREVGRNARTTVEERADWRINRQILIDTYTNFLHDAA